MCLRFCEKISFRFGPQKTLMQHHHQSRLQQALQTITSECHKWLKELGTSSSLSFISITDRPRLSTLCTLVLGTRCFQTRPSELSTPNRATSPLDETATYAAFSSFTKLICSSLVTKWEKDPSGQAGRALMECGVLEVAEEVIKSFIMGDSKTVDTDSSSTLSKWFSILSNLASNSHFEIKAAIAANAQSLFLPAVEKIITIALKDRAAASATQHVDHEKKHKQEEELLSQIFRFLGNACYGTDEQGAMKIKLEILRRHQQNSSSSSPSILQFLFNILRVTASWTEKSMMKVERWALHAISSISYGNAPNETQQIMLSLAAPKVIWEALAKRFGEKGASSFFFTTPRNLHGDNNNHDDDDEQDDNDDRDETGSNCFQKETFIFHALEAFGNCIFRFPEGQRVFAEEIIETGRIENFGWILRDLLRDIVQNAASEKRAVLIDVFCFAVVASNLFSKESGVVKPSAVFGSDDTIATELVKPSLSRYKAWRSKMLKMM